MNLHGMSDGNRHPSVAFHAQLAGCWEGKYKKKSFVERMRVFDSLLASASLDGRRWLDAGCGTGTLARSLAARGCRVVGVDACDAMIHAAVQHASPCTSVTFQLIETIAAIPFPDATFDGAVCSSVIEYVDDPCRCLSELRRVLTPGAHLLISVPNRKSAIRTGQALMFEITGRCFTNPWPTYMKFSKHAFTPSEFQRLLEAHGFDVVDQRYCSSLWGTEIGRLKYVSALSVTLARKA